VELLGLVAVLLFWFFDAPSKVYAQASTRGIPNSFLQERDVAEKHSQG